jgi:RNA-directed DNA polymerase
MWGGRKAMTHNLDRVSERDRPTGEAERFAEQGVWTPRMLECLRNGGPRGGRWFSLMDKVWSEKTLKAGVERVVANKGAAGVDGKDVEWLVEHQESEVQRLSQQLRDGTYRPQAVRRTYIPKPGSTEKRPLGIPTVSDRVVQAALKMVLEPIFEAGFHPCSHGFRPGRKAQDAMNATLRHLNEGRCWVIDADLKGYFDSIPHERLLAQVERKVADGQVLNLIRLFLEAGIMEGLELSEPESGTPQGGVMSPLLANIYLDELDHLMAQRGLVMERYADDFVVFCLTEGEARDALKELQNWTATANLTLHPIKTRIVDLNEEGASIDFLGYRLKRYIGKDGKTRILRLVRPKSEQKIKDKIRQLTPRKAGHSLEETVRKLNQTLRGWHAYFRTAHHNIKTMLDKFIRRRLRSRLCKSNHIHCWGKGKAHFKWTNNFFHQHGLFSLETAHERYLQSLRETTNRRAVCGKTARTVRREGRLG